MLQIIACGVQEILQIDYFYKKITRWISHNFSTIYTQVTTKNSGNFPILPIKLIKEGTFDWIGRFKIQIILKYVQILVCTYFCLVKDTLSIYLLYLFFFGQSYVMLRIQNKNFLRSLHCSNSSLWMIQLE